MAQVLLYVFRERDGIFYVGFCPSTGDTTFYDPDEIALVRSARSLLNSNMILNHERGILESHLRSLGWEISPAIKPPSWPDERLYHVLIDYFSENLLANIYLLDVDLPEHFESSQL